MVTSLQQNLAETSKDLSAKQGTLLPYCLGLLQLFISLVWILEMNSGRVLQYVSIT